MNRWFVVLFAALLVAGCEDKDSSQTRESESSAEKTQAAEESPGDGAAFGVGEIRVTGSQDVYRLEEVPNPDVVQQKLVDAIEGQSLFASSGDKTVDGQFTYDARKTKEGAWDMMIVGGVRAQNARFDAGINYKSSDKQWEGKSLEEMIEAGVKSIAEKLNAQAHVLGEDVDGIIAILKDDDEPEEAHLLAVQEIRERSARNATEHVKPFLGDEHSSKLRVAAAATLVSLGDETAREQILKVAEDLSRNRDPQYVPMLHILADLGGPDVITYLETVADGHSAPAVRRVAKEALKTARGEEAPK